MIIELPFSQIPKQISTYDVNLKFGMSISFLPIESFRNWNGEMKIRFASTINFLVAYFYEIFLIIRSPVSKGVFWRFQALRNIVRFRIAIEVSRISSRFYLRAISHSGLFSQQSLPVDLSEPSMLLYIFRSAFKHTQSLVDISNQKMLYYWLHLSEYLWDYLSKSFGKRTLPLRMFW